MLLPHSDFDVHDLVFFLPKDSQFEYRVLLGMIVSAGSRRVGIVHQKDNACQGRQSECYGGLPNERRGFRVQVSGKYLKPET